MNTTPTARTSLAQPVPGSAHVVHIDTSDETDVTGLAYRLVRSGGSVREGGGE